MASFNPDEKPTVASATTPSTLPLVSVAVPIYNHARYLQQCLDSILNEGYPNLELLLVDDGSSDDSAKLAAQWIALHRARFKRCVLHRQTNRGICATLNRLVAESEGKYFLPIASDDLVFPGGIEPRVRLLEQSRALAVLTNIKIIDDAGNILADDGLFRYYHLSRPHVVDPRSRPAELLLNWSMGGPILMVRKDAYFNPEGLGLYNPSLSHEDRDFFLRVLARPNGLVFLDRTAGAYRVHGGNHVANRANYGRGVTDYAALAKQHATRYCGSLRLALRLDGWEMKFRWKDQHWSLSRQRLSIPMRAMKKGILWWHRRRARTGVRA